MEACDLLANLKWCDWARCLRKRRNQFGSNLWAKMMMRRRGIELQEIGGVLGQFLEGFGMANGS